MLQKQTDVDVFPYISLCSVDPLFYASFLLDLAETQTPVLTDITILSQTRTTAHENLLVQYKTDTTVDVSTYIP